jgi:cytoskeletal protein CcmA (bactofilin family)
MFRRKSSDSDQFRSDSSGSAASFEPVRPKHSAQPLVRAPGLGVQFHPDVPHRSTALSPANLGDPVNRLSDSDAKRLVIAKEITLSGEISECDRLTVEGTVRAKFTGARLLEIAKSGLFDGTVTVENADISGTFEGQLTVRGRLLVRASGRVVGQVRYGQLEIERGGRLIGDVAYDGDRQEPDLRAVEGFAKDSERAG